MTRKPNGELRRGWTTGACATAATKAALIGLWSGDVPRDVSIVLPKGEIFTTPVVQVRQGDGWVSVGVVKDAGDDPDVTHGATVVAKVSASDGGLQFRAGEGVGTVTKPGLPIAVGEPAINPVPRAMIDDAVAEVAVAFNHVPDVIVEISVPGGAAIALETWNPRLGIKGGLSILGTTGVVRPFSCAAWIASIHRGIDVARANGLSHVAGCTGSTSEATVQALYGLPDHAMLDMGDFAGGMLKYLAKNPIARVTVGGGIGKLTKLAQGAVDLHSSRSQVDFVNLADLMGIPTLKNANTALEAYEIAGPSLPEAIAEMALGQVQEKYPKIGFDIVVIDRAGTIIGRAGA